MLGASTPQGQGAIGVSAGDIAALLNALQPGYNPIATAGNVALTAGQLASGFIVRSGNAAAVTDTTDTATNIINALTQTQGATPRQGQTFLVAICNLNTSTGVETIAGGAGVTITGTATIAISTVRFFLGTILNAAAGSQAVSLQSMFAIGSATA